jgi:pyruvate,orthophosphate dikinase
MAQDYYLVTSGRKPAAGGAAELGNKGWNLMRMAQIGLPVPPAAILPTAMCAMVAAGEDGRLDDILANAVRDLEGLSRKSFGGSRRPLLLSVRSGAAQSMPGMMETVLNVGLNDETVAALVRASGNPRLAWDCYRRLLLSYAEIVARLPIAPFAHTVAAHLAGAGETRTEDLSFVQLRQLTHALLATYREAAGEDFPQDVQVQLRRAVRAVFASWHGAKATSFRRLNGLDDGAGTAVTLQAMVFGNMGSQSGAGVAFTRDPADGADRLYLDFAFAGQGEDVVAGRQRLTPADQLATRLPDIWRQLQLVRGRLESEFGDAQDFEFTVEDGRLWLLQTRRAKRTAWAALQIAVDLFEQGVIDRDAALALLRGIDLAAVERRRLGNVDQCRRLGEATVASIGVACGRVAFDAAGLAALAAQDAPVILIRRDITTDDIELIARCQGLLTVVGGRTSHAAVVARHLGKVCLVDCRQLVLDGAGAHLGGAAILPGAWLTLDGNDGVIYAGQARFASEKPDAALARLARLRQEVATADANT